MSFAAGARAGIIAGLGVLRRNLPRAVQQDSRIALFALFQTCDNRGRAAGLSVPPELVDADPDPSIVALAVACASRDNPGWVRVTRRSIGLGRNEPMLGIGIVYRTRKPAADRIRITFTDTDGTGFLWRDGQCAVYPLDERPTIDQHDQETVQVYLATLILATLVQGDIANLQAELLFLQQRAPEPG